MDGHSSGQLGSSSNYSNLRQTLTPNFLLFSDPTGYSWHGDFQNGWETSVLQNAIDHCNNPNDDTGAGVIEACKYLNVIPAATANQCKITNPEVKETVSGTMAKLPG